MYLCQIVLSLHRRVFFSPIPSFCSEIVIYLINRFVNICSYTEELNAFIVSLTYEYPMNCCFLTDLIYVEVYDTIYCITLVSKKKCVRVINFA